MSKDSTQIEVVSGVTFCIVNTDIVNTGIVNTDTGEKFAWEKKTDVAGVAIGKGACAEGDGIALGDGAYAKAGQLVINGPFVINSGFSSP